MTILELIERLEDKLQQVKRETELEEKTGLFYNHTFREGEIFAYQETISLLKE